MDDKIDINFCKEDLIRYNRFFVDELEFLELSDIFFEVKVFTVLEYDEIEGKLSLRIKNQILLNYLEDKFEDKLVFFVYVLMQSEKLFILEKLRNF